MEQDWWGTGFLESPDTILFLEERTLADATHSGETQEARGSQLRSRCGSSCLNTRLTLAPLL